MSRLNPVVRGRGQLEHDRAGEVGRAVIKGHDRDHRLAIARRDGDRAGQRHVIQAVGGRAANGIRDGEIAVGLSEAAHGEDGVLGAAVGEIAPNGSRGSPVGPCGCCGGQAQPRPAVGSLDGDGVGRKDGDYVGYVRRRQRRQDGNVDRIGYARRATVVGGDCGKRVIAQRGVAPHDGPVVTGRHDQDGRLDRSGRQRRGHGIDALTGPEVIRARKELDVGYTAVAVPGEGEDGQVDRLMKGCAIGWAGDAHQRRQVRGRWRRAHVDYDLHRIRGG